MRIYYRGINIWIGNHIKMESLFICVNNSPVICPDRTKSAMASEWYLSKNLGYESYK